MQRRLLLSSLLGTPAASAWAQPALPRLRVVTENWRPYNYVEDGEIKGTATAVVRQVLERAGIMHSIDVLPWARAYRMALHEADVLIYTLIRIPPREPLFRWVGPLGAGGASWLYKRRGEPTPPLHTEAARRRTPVLTNNESMDHLMLLHLGYESVLAVGRVDVAIKMFIAGRAPLIAFDDAVLDEEFARLGLSRDAVEPVLRLFGTPPYMGLSLRTDASVAQRLQAALDELKREGLAAPIN